MINVSVFTTQIRNGEVTERLAARFAVRGQQLELLEGERRFVRAAMPVYSQRYGCMIDFDTDGEEWARNLPNAHRSGSVFAQADEVVESRAARPQGRVPVLLQEQARRF